MPQEETMLSVAEAASLLNISPTFLIKLLDEGAIPSAITGSAKYIQLSDVLTYKQVRDTERGQGMEQLVRLSEELGLYDRDE